MGTNTIPSAVDGTIIPASNHNGLKTALTTDLVPRDAAGAPTNEGGDLGSGTYQWKRVEATTGHWSIGDIKMHHSFNGAAPVSDGWFPCDGQVINSTNYDAIHGAGKWASHIISSALDGKNSPNFTSKYPVGATSTTQDGTAPITTTGNTSNQVNIQHSHTVDSHNHTMNHSHIWLGREGAYNVQVNGIFGSVGGSTTDHAVYNGSADQHQSANSGVPGYDLWTKRHLGSTGSTSPGTNNAGSTTQSIQPESIEVIYYIRII